MSDYKNGDTASWDASQVRRSQAGHTGRSQGNPSQQPQRRRRKRRRINPVLYILCVLVASAILAGVGWLLASDLCAFSRDIPSTTKITIEITADDDMGSIAEKLQDAGLIRYKWFFRLFAAVTGASEEVGIGTYELNTDMDYHALIAGMRSSSGNLSAETVTVTIPEGYTVRQTIALLAEKGVNTEEALTEAAQTGDFDYDFIDNEEFFSWGSPYTNLVDDIPKFCFFAKAALAALNYMNWIPDVVHCHDWQAALVPVYLRTLFKDSPVGRAKSILTIHNLRFQGVYNIPTIKYWSGLPDSVFNMGALQQDYVEANMLKGGLAYADRITTVSGTYAYEIQTPEYGERLEDHLRYHNWKLRGIVNGIDYGMWDPETDPALAENYGLGNVLEHKMANKRALQRELGLEEDESKFVIGLISRLTNQKGLDLVSSIIPQVLDGNTQVVVLGTGDSQYEDTFRYYEATYHGTFSACIQYDEARAHRIYAAADAVLVPSRFEPCGLSQMIAMRYGSLPIVRETGGLRDTVTPYNRFTGEGNGFSFANYDAWELRDAIRLALSCWNDKDVMRGLIDHAMKADFGFEISAQEYAKLYIWML